MSSTSAGGARRTWFFAKITVRVKKCLSTGPGRRFRSMIAKPQKSGQLRCLWRYWGPVPTLAHAALSQDLPHWIECHILAFEFFQGTSQLVVPDNPRTGVTRACRYEPDLNRTYLEMAQFYNVAIMPARPYKPRDKA